MSVPSRLIRAARLASGVSLVLASGAFAQSGPVLPTMPMPPSFSDPPPREDARPRGSRQAPAASRTRSETGAAQTAQRPKRYVPEEFDRTEEDGPRAKPFVSEGGRPGMGMRF